MCAPAEFNCWQYSSKAGGLHAFQGFVVGGPVLSLVVEHDMKIMLRKLLKKQKMVSVTDPTLKHYFADHMLDNHLIHISIKSGLLHAVLYMMVFIFFICA